MEYPKTVPTVPVAVAELLMTGTGELTVSARFAEPVPFALVAPKVTVDTPAVVGVPVIFPVEVLMDKPAGNPVAL